MPKRRLLAATLAVLVASAPPGFGAMEQQPPAEQQPAQPVAPLPTVQSLKVVPMAGKEERNDLKTGVMAPLVVQVLDQNLRPVEGAQVVFRFPLSGPSAFFSGNQNSQTTTTNADGQAAAVGWTANRQVGRFEIRVNASRRNETGEAVIGMWNAASVPAEDKSRGGNKHWYSSKWTKIAIIAGAGAGIAAGILLTRGGNGSSSAGTVTAIPGSPTIGGPR